MVLVTTLDTEDVLRTVQELESSGRALDAVQVLVDANRSHESFAYEQKIPDLRRAAYEELDRTPGFEAWPAPTVRAAPEPGPRGVPEIDVADLDATVVRAAIGAHGCLLVRGAATEEECHRLRQGIDRAFDQMSLFQEAKQAGGELPSTPWYTQLHVPRNRAWPFGRLWVEAADGVLAADSPRMLFQLLEQFERRGLTQLVAEYLGERPVLSATKCTLRRVPPDSDSHWHQDGSFLGTGLRVLNIWLTLTACGRDAPGLDLVPRRFDGVLETGTGDSRFANMVGHDGVVEAAGDDGILRPHFEPGEALLFDELFLHRTGADRSMPNHRYAVESWFFAPSAYPDPDDQVPLVV